jgi:MYXO-CTERM domain-containing protein
VRAGDDIELLLAERGHDLAGGRIRVAVGPSGIAVGFPEDPMLHFSWWALLALVLVDGLRRRRA